MAANLLAPAVLNYVERGAYPESEEVAAAQVGADALATLLRELRSAQDNVKREIRGLSQSTAPDIDSWIARAKGLQSDILRSRDTARQIVAEHETTQRLRAKAVDVATKVQLLEKEVQFEETLGSLLEHIRYANSVLDQVQEEAGRGQLEAALARLEQAEESIGVVDGFSHTKAVDLLQRRAAQVKESLRERATQCWNGLMQVHAAEKSVTIHTHALPLDVAEAGGPVVGVDTVVTATQGLDVFDSLLQKSSKDLERTIFRPRLVGDGGDHVPRVVASGNRLSVTESSEGRDVGRLFSDLQQMLGFLASHLPASIGVPLSQTLVPAIVTRLEEQWLDPAVPLEIKDLPSFLDTLSAVQKLANHIDQIRWHGTDQLTEWVSHAPRTLLTKRREAVLGDVRNLVFSRLSETQVVERIETQIVTRDDQQALAGGSTEDGDDDWDAGWDEPQEETSTEAQPTSEPTSTQPSHRQEEDNGNAWDTEDTAVSDKPPTSSTGGDDDDDVGDAWGWGEDEAAPPNPPSPSATQKPAPTPKVSGRPPPPPQEREMTLRETFTVTAIPDGILTILHGIVSDAHTLAGPEYASSPVAPAASALYTLPTLALAIYRATAPTTYAKLPTGNLLIYNDASRLADQLRAWQAEQDPASRLRVDNDVKALDSFAKRAYSSEMDSQRTILRDLLDGAQGFANVTKPPFRQAAEGAVDGVLARLVDVHRQWKGILSDGALLQSLGSLLATITSKMITEIEDLGDIGEEDSHQLRRLMDAVNVATDIFTQSGPGGEKKDMTFVYCPNWLKFQYLGEILESSLADIRYLWNEGELSLEFDAEEVIELIEGLFADSDMRRRAVQEIRRGARTM